MKWWLPGDILESNFTVAISLSVGSVVYQHLKTSSPGLSVNSGVASCRPFVGGGGAPPGGEPGGSISVEQAASRRTRERRCMIHLLTAGTSHDCW
jgi:hypothetical protein